MANFNWAAAVPRLRRRHAQAKHENSEGREREEEKGTVAMEE